MHHPFDRLVTFEEVEHRGGVGDVAFHPQRQRLNALQQIKRIGRRQARAEIAQAFARARMMKADGPNSSSKTMP
jgi:hypothetical protein